MYRRNYIKIMIAVMLLSVIPLQLNALSLREMMTKNSQMFNECDTGQITKYENNKDLNNEDESNNDETDEHNNGENSEDEYKSGENNEGEHEEDVQLKQSITVLSILTNRYGLPITSEGLSYDLQVKEIIERGLLKDKSNVLENGSSELIADKSYKGTALSSFIQNDKKYEFVCFYLLNEDNEILAEDENIDWSIDVKEGKNYFLVLGYKNLQELEIDHLYESDENNHIKMNCYAGDLIVSKTFPLDKYRVHQLKEKDERNENSSYFKLSSDFNYVSGIVPHQKITLSISYLLGKEKINQIFYLSNEQGKPIDKHGVEIQMNKKSILENGIVFANSYIKENENICLTVGKTYENKAENFQLSGKTYQLAQLSVIDNKGKQRYFNNGSWEITMEKDTDYTVFQGYKVSFKLMKEIFKDGEILKKEDYCYVGKPINSTIEEIKEFQFLDFKALTVRDGKSQTNNLAFNESRTKIIGQMPYGDTTIRLNYKQISIQTIQQLLFLSNEQGNPINRLGEVIRLNAETIVKEGIILDHSYIKEDDKTNLKPYKYYSETHTNQKLKDGKLFHFIKLFSVDDKWNIVNYPLNKWNIWLKPNVNHTVFVAYQTKFDLKVVHEFEGLAPVIQTQTYAAGNKIKQNLFDKKFYEFESFSVTSFDDEKETSNNISFDRTQLLAHGTMPYANTELTFHYKELNNQHIRKIAFVSNQQGRPINVNGEEIAFNRETILSQGIILEDDFFKENNHDNLIPDKEYTGTSKNIMQNGQLYEITKVSVADDKNEITECKDFSWKIIAKKNTDHTLLEAYRTSFMLETNYFFGSQDKSNGKDLETVYVGDPIKKEGKKKKKFQLRTFQSNTIRDGVIEKNKILLDQTKEYASGYMPYGYTKLQFDYEEIFLQDIRIISCLSDQHGNFINSKGERYESQTISEILTQAIILKDRYVMEQMNKNLIPNKKYAEEALNFIQNNQLYEIKKIFWINSKGEVKQLDTNWSITVEKDMNYTIFILYASQTNLTVEHKELNNKKTIKTYVGDPLFIKPLTNSKYNVTSATFISQAENNMAYEEKEQCAIGTMPYGNLTIQFSYVKKATDTYYIIEYYRDKVDSDAKYYLGSQKVEKIPFGTRVVLTKKQKDIFRPLGYRTGSVLNFITVEKPGQVIKVLYADKYKAVPYYVEVYLENNYGLFLKNDEYSGFNVKMENEIIDVHSLHPNILETLKQDGYEFITSVPSMFVLDRGNSENIIRHYFAKKNIEQLSLSMNWINHESKYEQIVKDCEQIKSKFNADQIQKINEIYDALEEKNDINELTIIRELNSLDF